MTFEQTTGTRAQVWHGTAKKTSGGLTKTALMMNKHGRIVSRKKHNTAKKEKRLVKAGFLTKKGQFGFIKKGTKRRRYRSRKMRGGADDDDDMGTGMGTGDESSSDEEYEFPFADSDDMDGGRRRRKMRGGTGCASGSMMGAPLAGGRKRRGSRKMRGGMAYGGPLSPLSYHYDGKGSGTSGVDLQLIAGNAG
jgi:hypothetical protein